MRKYNANPHLGPFYKMQGQPRPERLTNCSGLKEIKEQDYSMQGGFLDRVLGWKRDTSGTTGQTGMKFVIYFIVSC